jgi:hypothetical protein
MSRLRPSPAMVVAIIALIASVTSGAYAATLITGRNIASHTIQQRNMANNSVWHAQIGRGSVRNVNLAANSVWHAQIGTGSVRANNVQPALLAELQGAQGEAGPPGSTGPVGPTGPHGPTASTGFPASSTGTTLLSDTAPGTSLATSPDLDTQAAEAHVVLNGFVRVRRTAVGGNSAIGNVVTCVAHVTTNGGTASTLATSAASGFAATANIAGNVNLVGQTALGPGHHTITVSCSANAGQFVSDGGAFTAIVTG